jgi:hypothetical protein
MLCWKPSEGRVDAGEDQQTRSPEPERVEHMSYKQGDSVEGVY